MKQDGDRYTAELPGLETVAAERQAGGFVAAGAPRGRGRPRKLDALTPAQRAKRYRDKRRSEPEPWQWLREAYRELCQAKA